MSPSTSLLSSMISLQALGLLFGIWVLYEVSLVIYRLHFSPLAKFPGPRLAAASLWYEFYYDVIKEGRYTWKIRELHDKYGPIVRINPYELHIDDPEYYDELYTGPTRPRDKWAWSANMFGNSSSHFSSVPYNLHRMRRAPLNPFFSKQAVAKLEPMINLKVEKLSARLDGFRGTKEPVNLRYVFAALTMDVVTEYAFAKCYNVLDEPEFGLAWQVAIEKVSRQSHVNKQFPWLFPLMKMTPLWLVEKLNPHMMQLINYQMGLANQVSEIMGADAADWSIYKPENPSSYPTIFHELIHTSVLPESEKSLVRLVDEGQTIVAAGQVTTTHYLNTISYHILVNPDVVAKLKAELAPIMPDGKLPSLAQLEKLPYLAAVVLEGFRISYGVSHRLQRVAPNEALIYGEYMIPPGTPVSMTSIFMHENPSVFPEPKAFKPERWLNAADRANHDTATATADGAGHRLEKYLVNFGKGTRSCLGRYLAEAEIYLTLAALFGRFDMDVYETTREDIDIEHDFFNALPRNGAHGLRVLVK